MTDGGPSPDVRASFLIQSYATSMGYFDGFANRIWTRFSILISIDSALSGLFVTLWLDESMTRPTRLTALAALGIFISLIMYIQSAQDKFVLEQLRGQINRLKQLIVKEFGFSEDLPIFFASTAPYLDRKPRFEGVYSWRVSRLSSTRLPALISLVFLAVWCVAVVFLVLF